MEAKSLKTLHLCVFVFALNVCVRHNLFLSYRYSYLQYSMGLWEVVAELWHLRWNGAKSNLDDILDQSR